MCRRSGNPLLAQDLARVSVDMARAIVVLATAETPERSDARVLRIVLSLMGVHDRLKKAGIEGGLKVRPWNPALYHLGLVLLAVMHRSHCRSCCEGQNCGTS